MAGKAKKKGNTGNVNKPNSMKISNDTAKVIINTVSNDAVKAAAPKPVQVEAKKVAQPAEKKIEKAKPVTPAKPVVKNAAKPKAATKPAAPTKTKVRASKQENPSLAARDWVFAMTDQLQYGGESMVSMLKGAVPEAFWDVAKHGVDGTAVAKPMHAALDNTKTLAMAQVNAQQYAAEKTGECSGKLHDVSNSLYGESMDIAKLWLQARSAEDMAQLHQRSLANVTEAYGAATKAVSDSVQDVAHGAAEPYKHWVQTMTDQWLEFGGSLLKK